MADHMVEDTKQQARLVQHILILQRTPQILLHSTKTRLNMKMRSTNLKG
jgi:hypothetical protein